VALRVDETGEALGSEEMEAALLYTSGTTGNPKGCILTNTYFLEAGRWYAEAGGLCALTSNGERMITPLPIFHMNAMAYSFMAMVAVGGCLTVLDRFHPSSWWRSVRESGATCLHYLGVMPSMLMGAPEEPADRDHSVRFGFGAGVDPKLHAGFEARFGFPLVEAWAMTETGAGAVICANQLPRRVARAALASRGPNLKCELSTPMAMVSKSGPGELLVRRHAGRRPASWLLRRLFQEP
jgi:acyl-CoA synthetase (AMP-forming)/AMP-acid ligase II